VIIDESLCTRCTECVAYCPVQAIHIHKAEKRVQVSLDECVECGVCLRAQVCPTGALQQQPLSWPRTIRSALSDPLVVHPETRIPGRGTEEMKTNDVTGRYRVGRVGLALEMGRPGAGAGFRDIQRVAQKMATLGVTFEPLNPVTKMMSDPTAGTFPREILGERVLSAIIEFDLPVAQLPQAIQAAREVAQEIDTVFSLDICALVHGNEKLPLPDLIRQQGLEPSLNGKTNVGLGRPIFDFALAAEGQVS